MTKQREYPYPNLKEETFKDSKFTVFTEPACHGPHLPWNKILVQAPRGVAEDLMRNWFGVNLSEVTCDEHGSTWDVDENVDILDPLWAKWFWTSGGSGEGSFYVVGYGHVTYMVNNIWENDRVKKWKFDKYGRL